ncbi:MAG: sulfite exporter TauE/SafE family protein [Nitratireductor sp.]
MDMIVPDGLVMIIILGNAVVFAATVLQAIAGFGFAMIAIPCLGLVEISLVPGASLANGLIISVIMYFDERHEVDWREIRLLLPVVIVGTVLGAGLALVLPVHLAGAVFSGAILIGVAVTLFTPPVVLNGWTLGAGGLAAGIMGTVSGLHGPPLAIVYQHQPPAKIRATIAAIFIFANILSVTALFAVNKLGLPTLAMALGFLPGLIAGLLLARRTRHLVSRRQARATVLVLASLSAIGLLNQSLT